MMENMRQGALACLLWPRTGMEDAGARGSTTVWAHAVLLLPILRQVELSAQRFMEALTGQKRQALHPPGP